jgi:hypothetical protein
MCETIENEDRFGKRYESGTFITFQSHDKKAYDHTCRSISSKTRGREMKKSA